MRRRIKDILLDESGAMVIVEATFVFPIMFFVIFFLFFMGFCVFLKCFQEKIFCVSGSKIPSSDIFFSARVKITVPVSTDLEDDVIFFIKDF